MCSRITLSACLSLVLSSALWSQEAPSDTSILTPKQKALQLLDSLDQNNNEADNLSNQSEEALKIVLNENEQLKDSLRKTASYSQSLEASLTFSQTLNNIGIPTLIVVTLVAIGEGIYIGVYR